MRARDLFERMGPTEAPPAPAKPTTVPQAPPSRPEPVKHPNPFRRRRSPNIDPGPMPKPKAKADESVEQRLRARELFGIKRKPAIGSLTDKAYAKAREEQRELGTDDGSTAPEQRATGLPQHESQARSLFRNL